jgi:hypothetical protein
MTQFPAPGLDGTYQGSCIVCMHGTDTALAIRGPAEATAGFLVVCGVPMEEAIAHVEMFPSDDGVWKFRVCEACVPAQTNMKPAPVSEGIPVYDVHDASE